MGSISKVAAVVPSRNRIDRTMRFVEAFFEQSYDELSLIIVDSNSTDGTADWLELMTHPGLCVIHATDDDFWAGATNLGVKAALEAGYDYILTINDDSIPSPDLVSVLTKYSKENNWRILGSRVNFLDNMSEVWSVGSYNLWGSHRLFQLHDNEVDEEDLLGKYSVDEVIKVESICGNGVLIHRSVFEEVGLYDEKHCPHYHADSEFVMRANKAGIDTGICFSAVVYNDTSEYMDGRLLSRISLKSPWPLNVPNTSGFGSSSAAQLLVRKDPKWIGENLIGLRRHIRLIKSAVGLFFRHRSERRVKTIVYIIINYCPDGLRIKTIVYYFSHAILRFIFPRVGGFVKKWIDRNGRRRKSPLSMIALGRGVVSYSFSGLRRARHRFTKESGDII